MAASSSVTIAGSITGLTSGTKTLSGSLTNATAPGVITDMTLASGDNTITVPSGAVGVLIVPPSNNAATLKLKGDAADVGVKLLKTSPTLLALDPTQATIIINASALTASPTEFNFF